MKENKITNAFNYLIDDYHCSLSFEENRGDHYIFQNETFKLKVYVWEQFDELDIILIFNNECFCINPFIERPSLNSKLRGIKGFFFRYSEEFWQIISEIVKNKIKSIVKS